MVGLGAVAGPKADPQGRDFPPPFLQMFKPSFNPSPFSSPSHG